MHMRSSFVSKLHLPGALMALTAILVFFPQQTAAWGRNAHKLVVNQAIDTLPLDIRGFFESYRAILLQHVIDPWTPSQKLQRKSAITIYISTSMAASRFTPSPTATKPP